MQATKTIYELHEEHKLWLSKLSFYKNQLLVMRKWLEEVAVKNTSREVRAMVEHFQNQMLIQDERIANIAQQTQKHEFVLEEAANYNPDKVDLERFKDHITQRESMESFERIFHDLRKELINFLSKWM